MTRPIVKPLGKRKGKSKEKPEEKPEKKPEVKAFTLAEALVLCSTDTKEEVDAKGAVVDAQSQHRKSVEEYELHTRNIKSIVEFDKRKKEQDEREAMLNQRATEQVASEARGKVALNEREASLKRSEGFVDADRARCNQAWDALYEDMNRLLTEGDAMWEWLANLLTATADGFQAVEALRYPHWRDLMRTCGSQFGDLFDLLQLSDEERANLGGSGKGMLSLFASNRFNDRFVKKQSGFTDMLDALRHALTNRNATLLAVPAPATPANAPDDGRFDGSEEQEEGDTDETNEKGGENA